MRRSLSKILIASSTGIRIFDQGQKLDASDEVALGFIRRQELCGSTRMQLALFGYGYTREDEDESVGDEHVGLFNCHEAG